MLLKMKTHVNRKWKLLEKIYYINMKNYTIHEDIPNTFSRSNIIERDL